MLQEESSDAAPLFLQLSCYNQSHILLSDCFSLRYWMVLNHGVEYAVYVDELLLYVIVECEENLQWVGEYSLVLDQVWQVDCVKV